MSAIWQNTTCHTVSVEYVFLVLVIQILNGFEIFHNKNLGHILNIKWKKSLGMKTRPYLLIQDNFYWNNKASLLENNIITPRDWRVNV